MITGEVIPGGMLREWRNETEGRKSDQYGGVPEQTTAGDTWAPSPGTSGVLCRAHHGGARELRFTSTHTHPQLDTTPCAGEGLRQRRGTSGWGPGDR